MSSSLADSAHTHAAPIEVEPWPSETPLFVVSLLIALIVWLVAVVSVIGLIYAMFFVVLFWFGHLLFIFHVRGNSVRLGPDQFPELFSRVETIAQRMGLERVPEVYLMQAEGALNAFATRFLGADIVVLFSDLLEACGDNEAARDMIIGHELGHVARKHIRSAWFLFPARIVPFLGQALSRAREYTCDRYGLAAAGRPEAALTGLTILAVGGRHGPRVDRKAMARQIPSIETGWMTLAQWLSDYPPLSKRLVALEPQLRDPEAPPSDGWFRAVLIMLGCFVGLTLLVLLGAVLFSLIQGSLPQSRVASVNDREARAQAQAAMQELAGFVEGERATPDGLPHDALDLAKRWGTANPERRFPSDPWDGSPLGYERYGAADYTLFSSGPDQQPKTADDIALENKGGKWAWR